MVPFYTKFPTLAEKETRFFITIGDRYLPDGKYGFVESYCDDPHCDCHRVLINVISDNDPVKIYATINYGWKDNDFYAKLLGPSKTLMPQGELKGPILDDLNPQSKYASRFLEIFTKLLEDEAYVERFERHYHLFKRAVKKKSSATSNRYIKRKLKNKKKRKLAKKQRRKK